MNIEKLDFILNDALNKALISKDRIKQPNSNKVADFVSKYISDNNQALQLQQTGVISSVFRPEWLTYDICVKIKDLWDLPNVNNSNPRTSAIKLIREIAKHNGYEIDLKKSVELVKQHCL